jgi:hypothetical protein
MIHGKGRTGEMATVFTVQTFRTLILTGVGMLATAVAHAGPQVTFYLTLPLGGPSNGHVFGLRLDRASSPPAIGNINPASPLNRRALLDLQLGAHSALRLELDRRLTWDINRQQWHESSRPATFTLRVPTHERPKNGESRAEQTPPLLASGDQAGLPALKSLAIEP